ncbi:S49 family peptidase [Paraburkholderia tuberum]|uniref:Protein C Serine peptidase. MEROPS family S49 n=1 Tax=Paraburkholderia tuberum TaxID=157910 RepID=A0A1H1JSA8_9BURK|nr:S49 family peptidase [Paraburkholderia tuberum]SDR52876.1 protein C Serine peptidase. MEROPS family S49 [Paraburkholderia tuberum]
MNNYPHIVARALNRPLLVEPGYARVFFSALAPRLQIDTLTTVEQETLDGNAMAGALKAYDRASGWRAYQVVNGVAVIPVNGTLVHKNMALNPVSGMQGYDGIEAKLDGALADPEVRGILFDMNTPGGEVSGVHDLAAKITASTKPVWAHANELAASAGYWIASAADRVVLSETAEVGSIGVLMAHADYSKALQDDGINVTLIHAGAHKVDGNPYEPLPEDVRDTFKAEIEELRSLFAQAVATGRARTDGGRGMSVQAVLDTEARIYRGQQAVEAGLADAVMPFSEALDAFSRQLSTRSRIMSIEQARADAPGADVIARADASRMAEQAREEGVRAGAEAGASAERERIAAILGHAEAAGRQNSARTLALTPGMSPETAATLLAGLPVEGAGRSLEQLAETANVRHDASSSSSEAKGADFKQRTAELWKAHGHRAA